MAGELPNSSDEIDYRLRRQQQFLAAAEYVASAFAGIPSVRRVALFGSVATGKSGTGPRSGGRRRFREFKDVDLAVWMDDVLALDQLRIARSRALVRLCAETDIGVAHHQVDVFILDLNGKYLGRLCRFNCCPKGKPECEVKDCGKVLFLQQHEGFRFAADALTSGRIKVLYERQTAP